MCKHVRVQVREPPWLWGGSHEVQNRGNQWPHKTDLGSTKGLKNPPPPQKNQKQKQKNQKNLTCLIYPVETFNVICVEVV